MTDRDLITISSISLSWQANNDNWCDSSSIFRQSPSFTLLLSFEQISWELAMAWSNLLKFEARLNSWWRFPLQNCTEPMLPILLRRPTLSGVINLSKLPLPEEYNKHGFKWEIMEDMITSNKSWNTRLQVINHGRQQYFN